MRVGRFIARFFLFLIFATLAATVAGLVTMSLWNWLIPALFGAKTISFLQALGLLILGRLLFGGLRGGPGHGFRRHHWRRRFIYRWAQMTPAEREAFRNTRRARYTRPSPPPPTAQPAP